MITGFIIAIHYISVLQKITEGITLGVSFGSFNATDTIQLVIEVWCLHHPESLTFWLSSLKNKQFLKFNIFILVVLNIEFEDRKIYAF